MISRRSWAPKRHRSAFKNRASKSGSHGILGLAGRSGVGLLLDQIRTQELVDPPLQDRAMIVRPVDRTRQLDEPRAEIPPLLAAANASAMVSVIAMNPALIASLGLKLLFTVPPSCGARMRWSDGGCNALHVICTSCASHLIRAIKSGR